MVIVGVFSADCGALRDHADADGQPDAFSVESRLLYVRRILLAQSRWDRRVESSVGIVSFQYDFRECGDLLVVSDTFDRRDGDFDPIAG